MEASHFKWSPRIVRLFIGEWFVSNKPLIPNQSFFDNPQHNFVDVHCAYFCAREFLACGTHNRSNLHAVGGTSSSLLFDCIQRTFSTSPSYDPQSFKLSWSLTRSSSNQKINSRPSFFSYHLHFLSVLLILSPWTCSWFLYVPVTSWRCPRWLSSSFALCLQIYFHRSLCRCPRSPLTLVQARDSLVVVVFP